MKNLEELRNILPNWLKKEVIVNDRGKYKTLDFPFLDLNNDYMRLYLIEKDNDTILLTDDGESYAALSERLIGMQNSSLASFFGCSLESAVSALPGVNFNKETKEIYSNCKSSDDLGFTIAMLVESMIRCSSICTLTSFSQKAKQKNEKLKVSFEKNYLKKNNCSYQTDPQIAGNELSMHTFDFLVIGRQQNFVRLLNDRESQTKKALLYDWKDVVNYEKLPPLVAISKSGEPKNPKNKKENDGLTKIIKRSNILLFSEDGDAQRIDNYFSSTKAV